jgi:hypothetical protein
MVTLNMRVNRAKSPEVTLGRIAAQSFGLYHSQFGPLFAWFLLPAAGRSLWMIAQRGLVHRLHPDWPQTGIAVNADWGLSIYWTTLVLTCAGLAVYFVLAGPALAMSAQMVLRSRPGARSARAPSLSLCSIWIQFLSFVRAWWIFAGGLLGTLMIGATFLVSNPERALPFWYALAVLTFVVGIPVGIWISLRGFLVIPVANNQGLRAGALFARSAALTSGIHFKLCIAILAILALRRTLAVLAGWSLSHCAIAYPDASNLVTFCLFPLVIFVLDALCGPLWGTAMACVYADRIEAELLHEAHAVSLCPNE